MTCVEVPVSSKPKYSAFASLRCMNNFFVSYDRLGPLFRQGFLRSNTLKLYSFPLFNSYSRKTISAKRSRKYMTIYLTSLITTNHTEKASGFRPDAPGCNPSTLWKACSSGGSKSTMSMPDPTKDNSQYDSPYLGSSKLRISVRSNWTSMRKGSKLCSSTFSGIRKTKKLESINF